jgi:hypothetical protein
VQLSTIHIDKFGKIKPQWFYLQYHISYVPLNKIPGEDSKDGPIAPERFSYEQYGSKLAFAFRHAHSEIFWFCFFFFPGQSEIPKISRHHKNTQTFRLSPKPVLFIGVVVGRLFRTLLKLRWSF